MKNNSDRVRAVISPTIRKLIVDKALRCRNTPRSALALELRDKIKELLGEEGPTPTQETLERMISHARNHESPLDNPWHPLALKDKDYELTPKAVAKIFELKTKGLDYLSIRTALWISRLCELSLSVDMLYTIAFLYSGAELTQEIVKLDKYDTSDIDAYLIKSLQAPLQTSREMGSWDDKLSEADYKNFRQTTLVKALKDFAKEQPEEYQKLISELEATNERQHNQEIRE